MRDGFWQLRKAHYLLVLAWSTPLPTMCARVPPHDGEETKAQILEKEGRLPMPVWRVWWWLKQRHWYCLAELYR